MRQDEYEKDQHRWNAAVHYRLFRSHRTDQPAVICMQDFDYDVDFDPSRLLSPDAWDNEDDANEALREYLREQKIAAAVEERLIAEEVDRRVRVAAEEARP